MARTAVGQITYFDVSDGLTGPQGPAGPATLSRYRTATNAATAGRPLTDSGIDGNWTDNPDLVDGQTGDTIFVSNQFANITQSGNPYQTTIAGTGTSGAVWVPARPEVATIEVAADAMSSSRDSGTMESARFQISGNPGIGAVDPTPGVFTIAFTSVPSTLTYNASLQNGGADGPALRTPSTSIRETAYSGLDPGTVELSPDGPGDLREYALANTIADGTAVNTLDFLEAVLLGFNDRGNAYTVTTTRGVDSITGTLTQVDDQAERLLWTELRFNNSFDVVGSGPNDGITISSTNTLVTLTEPRVLGGEVVPTIPYVLADSTQTTFTTDLIRFQSGDTTSALLAQRFVDSIPTEITITNALASFGTSWSGDYSFSTFTSDEVEAIYDAIIQAGYQEDDEIVFTSDTGSGTYTIINITGFSISFRASPGSLNTGTPSDTMTFPHRIVGIEFTVTRDGSEVVITNTNVGNIAGSYSFAITQNNSSTIAVSSPIITEGESADSPSEVTIRTYLADNTEVDTTIMLGASLDATQITAQIAVEWPATGTGYLATANGRVVTLTGDTNGPRTDSRVANIIAGTTGNLTPGIPAFPTGSLELSVTYDPTDVAGVGNGDWVFRSGFREELNITPTSWPTSAFITFDAEDNLHQDVFAALGIPINTPNPSDTIVLSGVTLEISSGGNSVTYDITGVERAFTDDDWSIRIENGRNIVGSVPSDGAATTFTIGRQAQATVVGSTFTLTIVDGVSFETSFTGTRSSVSFANGSQSISLDIPPATDLSTEIQAEVLDNLNFNDIDMYELPISGATFQLQSQSRALGADQTVDVTFNAGDSSDASIFKLNESAGQNQVTDAVINGWSFARTDSTIG